MTSKFYLLLFFFLIFAVAGGSDTTKSENEFNIEKVQHAVRNGNYDSIEISNSISDNVISQENIFVIIIRIIGYLVLLTAIILLAVWLLRRFGFVGTTTMGTGSMDLLEMLPIGQGKAVVIIRVLDSVMVLSQTSQNIQLLAKIDGEKALDLIAATQEGNSVAQFKDVFGSFMSRISKTTESEQ